MIDTIKQFKKEHGREPNRSELSRLLRCTRVTVNQRLAKLQAEGKIKPTKAVRMHTADYQLI